MTTPWFMVDFDNTLMGTERMTMPWLVMRFNELYGAKISAPLTSDELFESFQGMTRERLCEALGKRFGIQVDYGILFAGREDFVLNLFRREGAPMADNLIESFTALRDTHGARFAVTTNNTLQRVLGTMRFAGNGRGEELCSFFGTHFFEAGDLQKPDPSVYLRAVDYCGADPRHAYAVEDSVAGARAGLAAGLKTFGFIGYAEHPAVREKELLNLGVAACFTDWADFPDLWLVHANR